MGNATTLQNLVDRALDYADLSGSGGVDQQRLIDYVNLGLSELHDMLVNSPNSDYFRDEKTYTVSSGTEDYALPTDFYKVLQVFYVSSSERFALAKWHPAEISGFRSSPLLGGTVELWYVRQFRPLIQPDEIIDQILPNGWDDYVALTAAMRLLMKEESDTRELHFERERQRARILSMIEPRDVGEPDAIGDISGRFRANYAYRGLETRTFKYRIMGQKIYFVEVEYIGV